jgi:hypothetical protein
MYTVQWNILGAVGISNIGLGTSISYRTIGYRIKVSIYQAIGYRTDVSPTESSWMLRPLDIVPLTDVSQPWTASRMDRTTHGCHVQNFAPRGSQRMDRIKNARPLASTVLTRPNHT